MGLLLQEGIDRFVCFKLAQDADQGHRAEACMESLSDYLLHFSDLYHDDEDKEEMQPKEWEQALDAHMRKLLDGDVEHAPDLGNLALTRLDAEHFRDFLGWYLLRELGADSSTIQEYCDVLRSWLAFLAGKGWMGEEERLGFLAVIAELESECIRVARAAQLLLGHARLGAGVDPRLRGRQFTDFVEGHARIARLEQERFWLKFDNQENCIGPVQLPTEMTRLLKAGDVLDAELGKRGDNWLIVDIGPVYPAAVYVEADQFELRGDVS